MDESALCRSEQVDEPCPDLSEDQRHIRAPLNDAPRTLKKRDPSSRRNHRLTLLAKIALQLRKISILSQGDDPL
ncbi:hypothetical protein MK280_06815, partial [Myxococcota bacterium]|nr:hypothetical protein [Myxococcota bacterium]